MSRESGNTQACDYKRQLPRRQCICYLDQSTARRVSQLRASRLLCALARCEVLRLLACSARRVVV
eukprot:2710865-Pleurochrysis_carterae.AAC.2